MKVIQINGGVNGSIGKIMFGISDVAALSGIDMYTYSPKSYSFRKFKRENHELLGTVLGNYTSRTMGEAFGLHNQLAVFSTLTLIRKLNRLGPDIIHLHNLHGDYVNLPMLFSYVKKNKIPVVWTLHDCWSFTGHCPYFDIPKCDSWKTECDCCTCYKEYPPTRFDDSKKMFHRKKSWFTGVDNMTIVPPSHWLAGLVSESFLKEYRVKVIHNGINLDIFKPTESTFREKYGITDKIVVLGCSFSFGYRKGLDIFEKLAEKLDDRFKIVLVGLSKSQKVNPKIVAISKTSNQNELAEIYSAADVFLNPTREDNFPTVNLEALACGTPVITFRTGGSPEAIDDTCGIAIDEERVVDVLENECFRKFSQEACVRRAQGFNAEDCFTEYISIYNEIRRS